MAADTTGSPEEAGQVVGLLEATSDRLERLPFIGIHSVSRRPGDIEAALAGTFRLGDERFALVPPVDWWDEPYKAANERGFFQNSFTFADPLLVDPRFPEVVASLADLLADWLSSNPRNGASQPHRYAWHDHAAAGRIVVMAYILREGIRLELLNRAMAETLAEGVLEHARYLLADENYAAQNNHGFVSDAALTLAARSLEPVPQTKLWAKVAERRLATILSHMIDGEEAIHLEHSPYYHWIIHGALTRFAAAELFADIDLGSLTQRMDEAGAWLVAPDGTLPPLGDTPSGQHPSPTASVLAESLAGMRVFPRAGYAAVRAGGSALFVTAAHHPTAHKHADDGSFCLYEDGKPIVLDSGNPGYEYDSPEFRYGTSPAAHATICVDGFDWARESPAYGSGMLASTEYNSLYGLLTHNPGAVPGGGAAKRILVYRPSHFLLAIDDTEAGSQQRLVRSVPLAPGLEAKGGEDGSVEFLRDGATVAKLVQLYLSGGQPDQVELTIGVRQPEMRGFSFPSPGEPQASCDISLVGAGDRVRAYAVLLREVGKIDPVMTWQASGDTATVTVSGLTESSLTIRIGAKSLAIETP